MFKFYKVIFLCLILMLLLNQIYYFFEFCYLRKNLKNNKNDEFKDNRRNILNYNYNLSRLNYIYFVKFSFLLKFCLKNKINFKYFE